MHENKTQPTKDSVEDFLNSLEPEQVRDDCKQVAQMMYQITGEKPILWGKIVGFGKYHYKYASGREGDTIIIGFAPRKQAITLYMSGFGDYDQDNTLDKHLPNLGKHSVGKGCLYIKRLSDVDIEVLKKMIADSYALTKSRHAV